MEPWGKSCSIDIKECIPELIRSAAYIQEYAITIVKELQMVRFGDAQVVRFGSGDKMGYTLVQLIETSCITAHFSEETNTAYIDIFSCKDYNHVEIAEFSRQFFGGKIMEMTIVMRN